MCDIYFNFKPDDQNKMSGKKHVTINGLKVKTNLKNLNEMKCRNKVVRSKCPLTICLFICDNKRKST